MKIPFSLRWKLFRRNWEWKNHGFWLSFECVKLPGYVPYLRFVNHVYVNGTWTKLLLGAMQEFDSLDDVGRQARGQARKVRIEAEIQANPQGTLAAAMNRELKRAKAMARPDLAPPPRFLSIHLETDGAHYSCGCGWTGRSTKDGHPFRDDCPHCKKIQTEAYEHLESHKKGA